MAKEQVSINLLNSKEKNTVEKFLDWSLAIGRLLIILTETVALAAFLYRFSIDRRLIDLSDEIKKNQSIVAYFNEGEKTYRATQQKLLVSKTNTASTAEVTALFQDMMRLGGDEVKFTNVNVGQTEIEITVSASNVVSISEFISALTQHNKVAAVSLDKIENKTSNAVIIVTLTATLKNMTVTAQGGQM